MGGAYHLQYGAPGILTSQQIEHHLSAKTLGAHPSQN